MTTNHPVTPVAGYTQQPQWKLDAVNANKEMEESLLRNLDLLKGRAEVDQRWLAIARTHLEESYMALNRAIFQPQRIKLPGDTDATP